MMRFHTNKLAVVMAATLVVMAASIGADALAGGGSNYDHELLVYAIEDYGNLTDYCTSTSGDWKPDIYASEEKNPYDYFWSEMYTNCSTTACAHTSSVRRYNSAVTVNNMVGSWRTGDMVFFYGHNAMIEPQWSHPGFGWWQPDYIGDIVVGWCQEEDDWLGWGTDDAPYYYHYGTIDDASLSNAGAVFYAYNPLTSVLPGFDFIDGTTWYYENTKNGSASSWNVPLSGGELEWIVADGCQAVTTAKAQNGTWTSSDPIVSNSLGVNAWSKSWGLLHMVLGHYYTSNVSCVPTLGHSTTNVYDFASMLKGGDEIKAAYFDLHGSESYYNGTACNSTSSPGKYQPSAIARSSTSCCTWNGFMFVCPTGGCSNSYMNAETWTGTPMADISSSYYYATAWRVAE